MLVRPALAAVFGLVFAMPAAAQEPPAGTDRSAPCAVEQSEDGQAVAAESPVAEPSPSGETAATGTAGDNPAAESLDGSASSSAWLSADGSTAATSTGEDCTLDLAK